MSEAISECLHEGHWRLSAILRSRRYFSLLDLVLQYKSQVLSYLEYRTCGISHAADIHLYHLDSVQRRLLSNVELTPYTALQNFNLAPLSCRRDIANLAIVYRGITRRGPKKLWKFFKLDTSSRRTSPRWNFHRFQLSDEYRELRKEYLNRSVLGYVSIFNILPDAVFVADGDINPIPVQDFQRNINNLLKLASQHVDTWQELYSSRVSLVGHTLLEFRNIDRIPS